MINPCERCLNHAYRDDACCRICSKYKEKIIAAFIKYCEENMPCDICDGYEALEEMWNMAEQMKEQSND